jgi:hypothetical protein
MHSDDEELHLAARRLLDEPLYAEVISQLRTEATLEWQGAESQDTREALWHRVKGIEAFEWALVKLSQQWSPQP